MKESRLKKMRKPEDKENPLAKVTYRVLSERIVPLIARTSITPNQVSLISVVFALISGTLFSFGTWSNLLWGFLFLQLTILFDHIDGNLARYNCKASELGRWTDMIANKVHKFFWVLGASVGVFRMTKDPTYLILGSIIIFGWHFSAYLSETSKKLFLSKKSIPLVFKSRKTYFSVAIVGPNLFGLFALVNRFDYGLWFFSFLIPLWGIIKIISVYRKWKKVKR